MTASMFQRLLVPLVDGDLTSRSIDAGIAVARRLGATITGFVAEPLMPKPSTGGAPGAQGATVSVEELRSDEHAQRLLEGFRKEAQRAGVAFDGDHTHAHDVADSIVQAAQRHHCDLIVLVTHARGALGRLVIGSQTRRVLSRSRLPVLVLPAVEAPRKEIETMFKHLLVPVDGSDLGDRALQTGIDLARQLGASITAFIAELPPTVPATGYSAVRSVREVEEQSQAAADHAGGVLAAFERRAQGAGVPFNGVSALAQHAEEAIAETARQQGCDLIVMVTHGRGPFGELLFGSCTKGVMARSKLPLLVLH